MFQVKQNESTASRKRLPILLVDATDGFTPETGVTSPTISISKNGAAAASGTGSFVEIGFGQYYYEFASGEIDTLGWTAVYVIKTGTTRAYNAIVQIMAYDYAVSTNLGLSSLPTAAIGATGALLTSYTSNGALDVTATGSVNNVETVVGGVTLTAGTGSSVAQDVWNYDISGIGATNLAGGALEAAASGTAGAGVSVNEIATAVWYYDLTAFSPGGNPGLAGDKLNNADVYIWNYDTAVVTNNAGFYLMDTLNNTWFTRNSQLSVEGIADQVWISELSLYGNPNQARNLLLNAATGSSVASVANEVWSTDISGYTSPSAGYDLANAGSGTSSALTNGDVEGLRYRLGIDGTATAPTATGNLGVNSGSISSAGSVTGNVLGNINGNVEGDVLGNVNNVNNFAQGAIQTVWQYEETGIGLTTSIGYRLKTNIDAQVSQVDNNVWSYNTGTGSSAAAQLNAAAVAGAGSSSALEIAQTVWGLDISAYTSPSAGYELLNAGAGSGGSSAVEIANAVWEANVVGVGGTTSAAFTLTNTYYTAGNIESYVQNQTPQDIWTYSGLEGRTITGGTGVTLATAFPANFSTLAINGSGEVTTSNPGTGSSTPAEIASAVWSAGSRTITGGTITTNNDKTGYSLTQAFPSNFSILSINGSGQVTTSNPGTGASTPTQIAQAVWGYNTGTGASAATQLNLAAIGDSAATAKAVWDTELTLNTYPLSNKAGTALFFAYTNTDNIPNNVWRYDSSGHIAVANSFAQLAWYAASGSSSTTKNNYANAIWNYNTGTGASAATQLNAAAIAGSGGSSAVQVAQEVWGYATRDITGGTIDTNNDKTGYTLTQTFPPNFEDLSITSTTGLVTITNPGTGSTATPQDVAIAVWEADPAYHNNNSTFGKAILRSDNSNITGSVTMWSGASYNGVMADAYRIDESYDAAINLKNVLTGIGSTVTGNIVGSVDTVVNDVNVSAGSIADIADATWSEDISGYTSPSAGYELANVGAGSGGSSAVEIAEQVWVYATRDITGGTIDTNNDKTGYSLTQAFPTNFDLLSVNGSGEVITSNPGTGSSTPAEIAAATWSYATRDITGGTIDTNNDKTGYSLTQSFPTNFDLLSINGSGEVVASNAGSGGSSAVEVANAVWSFDISTGPASPAAAYYIDNINTNASSAATDASTAASNTNDIGGTVWSYDPTALTVPQAGAILTDIQSDTNTIISDIGNVPNNVWASDVSGYSTPGEAGFELYNAGSGGSSAIQVAEEVWGYATRDITGGTIDTNNDKTGYSLTQSFPTNFDLLSINGSGEVVASNAGSGGSSAIQVAEEVWSYATRDITGGEIDTNNDKTGYSLTQNFPANFEDLSITATTGLVTTSNPGTGSTATPQDVAAATWTYGSGRTITGGTGVTLATSLPSNFSTLSINGSGEVTTSNPGTGSTATVQQVAAAVWTANRASIGASDGQFGYYLNAPVSAAGGTVTQVMLGPFSLAATDGNNGYLNVFVDDERPVELVIVDQNGNAIPLDSNNTHSVLVYDSGSTLVATYTGTVEYEAGGLVSFPLDADVTGAAGSYKVVFDIDNGLTISKYGGLTILVRLC